MTPVRVKLEPMTRVHEAVNQTSPEPVNETSRLLTPEQERPKQISPRERMIESALILMGQKGVEATSFSQVIEHSGAPRGSIYHHFPGGKAQLVEEATRYAGDIVANLAEAQIDPDDPLAGLQSIGAF